MNIHDLLSLLLRLFNRTLGILLLAVFAGCTLPPKQTISAGHIQEKEASKKPISLPPPLVHTLTPPPVSKVEQQKMETYSVVVKDVDLRDLLFSLARDAKVDIDISPKVAGMVTLNAIDKTLPQILQRLSMSYDLTYEVKNNVYRITPDKPVLRSYRVEYPNIIRKSSSNTTLQALDSGTNSGASSTLVSTSSTNDFWDRLHKNIENILRETDKEVSYKRLVSNTKNVSASTQTAGEMLDAALNDSLTDQDKKIKTLAQNKNVSSASQNKNADSEKIIKLLASNVIVNPEAGIIQVRATNRQHAKIKEFIDLVLSSAQRQVLIEATVAEVQLSQQYEKGIDWSLLKTIAPGVSGAQTGFGSVFRDTTNALLNGSNTSIPLPIEGGGGKAFTFGTQYTAKNNTSFLSSIRLLEAFGNVKVLSSPKLSVLNNQTALLKITDNLVYFLIDVSITQNQGQTLTTYESTIKNTPVGFVMSVTPFIGNDGIIQLSLRPSISRIIGYKNDPSPALARSGVTNSIPIIRSREIESIMRVADGQIAVLGGLMEDVVSNDLSGLPGLSNSSAIGDILSNKAKTRKKTELVIFIRPRIIRHSDVSADYSDFRRYMLDDAEFQAPYPNPPKKNQ